MAAKPEKDPYEQHQDNEPQEETQTGDEGTPDEATETPEPPKPKARATSPRKPQHRFEEFNAEKPDGTVVRIRRNIDTGEQEFIK